MKRKWLYSELKLSEVLGLSRAQLKACRMKGEYRHGRGKGGPVELSQRGVEKVLGKFGIQDANLDGARLKRSGESQPALNQDQSTRDKGSFIDDLYWAHSPDGSPEKVKLPDGAPRCIPSEPLPALKLVHVSKLVPNKRRLLAQNGTGEVYDVIVPCNLVWAIGDPLRIKPSATHQGYWQLEGKAPRWKGDRMYRLEFA